MPVSVKVFDWLPWKTNTDLLYEIPVCQLRRKRCWRVFKNGFLNLQQQSFTKVDIFIQMWHLGIHKVKQLNNDYSDYSTNLLTTRQIRKIIWLFRTWHNGVNLSNAGTVCKYWCERCSGLYTVSNLSWHFIFWEQQNY